ncbi:MAG: hydantoinase/oxoprolinase family protein, partial [Eggerthella lenta]
GFPRESGVAVTIGGVRTNFRMPDVVSIGLGGGSIVRVADDGSVTVGPDSVGYAITERALVFGGDTMTATDIAVRLGMASVGDASLVADIPQDVAERAMAVMRAMVEDAIDVMKCQRSYRGAGSAIVLPTGRHGRGGRPSAGCANAIGSAISKVSGVYEALVDYDVTPRDEALAAARAAAVEAAVEAGAVRDTVEIIDAEDVPLAYYPGHTNRVKVKAAGDLA